MGELGWCDNVDLLMMKSEREIACQLEEKEALRVMIKVREPPIRAVSFS